MKPFDLAKFRTGISKSIPNVSAGFHDPKDWISTGNFALNYLISGNFHKGVPLGKVSVFAGESGSAKSLLCSGNIVRNAQKLGCQVVLFDSENALDSEWLEALDVDTSPEKLLKINASMIDDVARTMSEFMKEYKSNYSELPYDEMPKMLFVVDSLGMLLTPTDVEQFQKGDMKGDMGRKPKALNALVRNMVNQLAPYPVGFLATNHTYASQDMFNPDAVISGGQGFIFASSIVVAMQKLKLKEDEAGNKISEVRGIRAACKVMKSRYSKPFESIQVKIPYETGVEPYSGLVDLFEKKGLLQKTGNKLLYVDKSTGEEIKYFRKGWESNTDGCLDLVMSQYSKYSSVSEDSQTGNIDEEVQENNGEPISDLISSEV